MFGIRFRSKVRSILDNDFGYQPGAFQAPVLRQICSSAKAHRANEYDAAVMFMLAQMNALFGSDKESKIFIKTHVNSIRNIYGKCQQPSDDIEVLIANILHKHGI